MSAPEVAHRVSTQSKRLVSRFRHPRFAVMAGADMPLPVLPGLTNGVRDLADAPGLLDSWREVASRARKGRLFFFGTEWPRLDGPEKWHVDPVTGRTWPANVYCFAVPYRHAPDYGDVKYVWELNRLQYLQPVAALAAVTGDSELARFCAGEIESWIDANPPFDGVNWASGIELALRIVSIVIVTTLIDEEGFTSVQKRKVLAALAAHGYWLMRYPSRFSSANNHLIAEAGGLYLLGMLMPGLRQAARYAEYGRRVLHEETPRQIYEDGVGAEQSPTYEAFVLEWLVLCGEVGNRMGKPFSDAYWQRIGKAGEFLRWITDSAGNQPRIGDDDEGRVFYSNSEPDGYVSSILGCVATALRRPDIAPPSVDVQLCHVLFGRPKPGSNSPIGIRRFATGGYTVRRWMEKGAESLLVVDHGPLGYLSIAAHGHADALAIWLHIDGRPVLIDAGTYLYHTGGGWRDHFRSSGAHNTLAIEGENSSQITGPFNWGKKAGTKVLSFNNTPDEWYVEAEHDGYVAEFGVRHRRRLEQAGRDTFVITDCLVGNGPPRPVEIGFLVHPELDVVQTGNVWTVNTRGRALIRISHDGILSGSVLRGADSLKRGWYSPKFGDKRTCPRITCSGELAPGEECRFIVEVLRDA